MEKYCLYCMEPLKDGSTRCGHCGKDISYTAPAHHISAGEVLNKKYLVGAALGEGGFGITYIGRDLTLDMRVAIKEYFPNGYVNRNNEFSNTLSESSTQSRKEFFNNGLERFLKEARILARFSGEPGIVDVRDFFEENNTAYIVMEYLDGKTLKQLLEESRTLNYEEVMRLLTPIMMSLKEIHKQGLIHRDISPDNIMIIGNKARLLDFGAARNVSAIANKSLSVMLKPGYAPEEQYRSKGNQGSWTDVYAISATIYRCITGVTPDDAAQRVYTDEVKTPSELGINVPSYFEKALMKGMAVFQKDRYATIDELISGLNGSAASDNEDEDDQKTIYLSKSVTSDNEDDMPTRYLENEDDKPTSYLDSAADSEDAKKTTYQPPVYKPTPVSEPAVAHESKPVQEPKTAPEPAPVIQNQSAAVPAKAEHNTSDNEDDMPTRYLENEDDKPTSYLDSAADSEDAKKTTYQPPVYKPTSAPEPTPVHEPKPAPEPAPVIQSRAAVVPKKTENVPVPVPAAPIEKAKSKGSFKTKLIILISAAALLVIAGVVIIPNVLRSIVSNTLYNDDTSNINIYGQTLTREDTAQIAKNKNLKSVIFNKCVFENGAEKELSKIENRLFSFSMKDCSGFSDLSFISALSPSSLLEVSNCGITDNMLDTVQLSQCPDSLILNGNPELSTLKILEQLPEFSMWRLDISDTAISDLSLLERCTALSFLRANNCRLTDLSALGKMPANSSEFNSLSLYLNNNEIKDLTPLKECPIVRLEISDNEVSTLEPLADCKKLTWLYADRNKLTSLTGLENSLYLTHLSARENKISELSGITNCTILERVDLSKNEISDISLLSKSKETLGWLYLNGNTLDDIHVLDDFKALHYLNIDDTSVSELPEGCTGLIGISAQNNKLLTASELQDCRELEYVYLADNDILLAGDFNSDKLTVCDLSGNGFNYVSANNWGSLAAVYNNPIGEDISVPEEYPDISEKANTNRDTGIVLTAEKIILSYSDSINFSGLKERGVKSFDIVDCPKDKQISLKKQLDTVNFITPEEAQKEILSKRIFLDGFSPAEEMVIAEIHKNDLR